jgi:hypothetical protein
MAQAEHPHFPCTLPGRGAFSRFIPVLFFLLAAASLMPPSTQAQGNPDRQPHSQRSTSVPDKTLTTTELNIVDAQGRPRLRLSAASTVPTLQMFNDKGGVALEVSLDNTSYPSIALMNPTGGSTASLAVDPKGAHVKFDRPGGASSYLFLNDEGVSGVVLLDKTGKRRYELLLNADSSVTTRSFDDAGNALP